MCTPISWCMCISLWKIWPRFTYCVVVCAMGLLLHKFIWLSILKIEPYHNTTRGLCEESRDIANQMALKWSLNKLACVWEGVGVAFVQQSLVKTRCDNSIAFDITAWVLIGKFWSMSEDSAYVWMITRMAYDDYRSGGIMFACSAWFANNMRCMWLNTKHVKPAICLLH